jgi:O-acetyl-ADP-ribose deacetylase (regulator of RNase III)
MQILVRQGDITTYDGDAIVNAANNHLVLGTGVAGAIRKRGGPSIQDECDRHGRIRVGEAAITSGGDLPTRWVIHAAAMGDEPVSARSIRESTEASLVLAEKHGIKRLAFPVLGSGIGGFGFRDAATIMRDAVQGSPQGERLDEVVFFGFTPEHVAELESVMG